MPSRCAPEKEFEKSIKRTSDTSIPDGLPVVTIEEVLKAIRPGLLGDDRCGSKRL
jgi:hypothetical protein